MRITNDRDIKSREGIMMYDLIIYNHGTCKTKNRICNNLEEVMENCPVQLYPVAGG